MAEHSPLYKAIAEQVSAYIDVAVTIPAPHWGPPYTWSDDELPMEVLYDYDESFPLPDGLDSILAIYKISDDHRTTMIQVMYDLLNLPTWTRGVEYHIKELRLAYRSRRYYSILPWDIRPRSTPLVSNYTLLARAERATEHPVSHLTIEDQLSVLKHPEAGDPRQSSRRPISVKEFDPMYSSADPDSCKEKRLPSYIGGKIHARLVDVKARLDAKGSNDLRLVPQ